MPWWGWVMVGGAALVGAGAAFVGTMLYIGSGIRKSF